MYLVNEMRCFYCRVCGLSAPALFIFLQKPLFQNQVQATLVVLASRGRSRSSTSPQRKEARSDVTSVIVYLNLQLEFRIYSFSLFFVCLFGGLQSDGPYSGHSSSNTLSSTASSGGHSDSDKWYEMGVGGGSSGDQAETEPNGLGGGGYLQGASADSGIDTSSFGAPHHSHSHSHHGSTTSLLAPSGSREGRERSVSPWHSPTEGSRRMLERSPAAAESSGPPGERSLDGTGRIPPTHLLIRDSSTYSLSDAGSHPRFFFVLLS